jgi:L-ribulose-5-phosphate 3-epimerase
MSHSRRRFLEQSAFGAAVLTVLGRSRATAWTEALARAADIRVGGCDWSLKLEGQIGSFAVAKAAGLDGVQVSLGKGEDVLPLADPAKQQAFVAESKKQGMPIGGTCLEILHRDNLKAHPKGPAWVEQSIAPTAALGAKVVLLPFFGKQAITERGEQKAVAERLKPIAPLAEKAGVILGLENTISAEDNARILEEVASPAVKVYYDVGNSYYGKFDVYKEVVWLGKDRICQLHLKDADHRLGQGPIDFPRFVAAVFESGFAGWAMLETSVAQGVHEDFAENGRYVKGLLASA